MPRLRVLMLSGLALASVLVGGCGEEPLGEPVGSPTGHGGPRPSILLVTLDTTRADVVGFEGGAAATPVLDRLAGEGIRFRHAYAPAPMTLPAHASMLTGLYPAGHGVHENGRSLARRHAVVAERLGELGYATAAVVSGYPLARQFGLARGFDRYDDGFVPDATERTATATTAAALAQLDALEAGKPLFLWVHYFDAHDPFEAPEPFASAHPDSPYAAEVAYVDHEMGRLVDAFRSQNDASAIVVAGDHGEGLGDHGEERHGNLLYDGVMRVPLVLVAPGLDAAEEVQPVSTRRVFHTLLHLAGDAVDEALTSGTDEVVLAEAMKPYLQYGWQPQVMAVSADAGRARAVEKARDSAAGVVKLIRSGDRLEVYDLDADAAETRDLSVVYRPAAELLDALRSYPLPEAGGSASEATSAPSAADAEKLAALGYVTSNESPPLRPDAPHARDMAPLFEALDRGAGLFAEERWSEAVSVYESLAERDPENLTVHLRLAVAHSLAGHRDEAELSFQRAATLAPDSTDRRRYEALHYCRFRDFARAADALEPIFERLGDNVPALECMAEVRLDEQRLAAAGELLRRVTRLRPSAVGPYLKLAQVEMTGGATDAAIEAFERAHHLDPRETAHFALERGVLYLAARRFEEARDALDTIPVSHQDYAMVLFKRAQVAVLLGEPDAAERVREAYERSTPTTRSLIEGERLFAKFDGAAGR